VAKQTEGYGSGIYPVVTLAGPGKGGPASTRWVSGLFSNARASSAGITVRTSPVSML